MLCWFAVAEDTLKCAQYTCFSELAPRVFKFLQHGRSLNVLLATNTGMRDLVQQYVTHITIPDQSHMLTFAQDQWPSLQRMSLKSVQDPSAVAGLSRGFLC